MQKRQKIAIVLPNLGVGGAERVCLQLAEEFLRLGHDVSFVLRFKSGGLLDDVPPGVAVHDLAAPRVRNMLFPLVRYLRRERPDIVFSALWPLSVIVAWATKLFVPNAKVVVSEHNDFRENPALPGAERTILRRFGRAVYSAADGIVAVSNGVAESLQASAGLRRDRISVIYNPIRSWSGSAEEGEVDPELLEWWSRGKARLIAIGSLKPQKGFDILIRAMHVISDANFRLIILGEGTERANLEKQISAHGLQEQVRLAGFRANPFPYLASSDRFVLSSRWEGLGNVITEALSVGTPVIATDCRSGPREILEDGRHGVLVRVEDAAALAEGILHSLGSEWDRSALRARALDFQPEAAASAYLQAATSQLARKA